MNIIIICIIPYIVVLKIIFKFLPFNNYAINNFNIGNPIIVIYNNPDDLINTVVAKIILVIIEILKFIIFLILTIY